MVYAAREWRVRSTLSGTQSGGAVAHLMKLFCSKINEKIGKPLLRLESTLSGGGVGWVRLARHRPGAVRADGRSINQCWV